MMKKTKVALGVVIALGVVWVGGAWYSGKQIEKQLDNSIDQLNQRVQTALPGSGLVFSYQNYHRGLFSSQGELILTNNGHQQSLLIPAGQALMFDEHISHGPFPLAQLKHFNLLPAMASVSSKLLKNETTQELFAQNSGRSPLSAETRVGYRRSTSTNLQILPLKQQNQDGFISTAQAELQLDSDKNLENLTLQARNPQLQIGYTNAVGNNVVLTFKGLDLTSDSQLSPEKLRVGTQRLSLEGIDYSLNGKSTLSLEDLALNSTLNSQNNRLTSKLTYAAKDVKWYQQSLGQLKVDANTEGFNATRVKEFIDQYNGLVDQRIADLSAGDSEAAQQQSEQLTRELLAKLPSLLEGAPQIHINQLALINGEGESKFSLIADFNDPAHSQQSDQAYSLGTTVDGFVKQFKGNLQINKSMANRFVTAIGQAQGHSAEESATMAEKEIAGLAAMGQMFHLTTEDQHNINAQLDYAQGQITLNGKQLPIEKFLQTYLPLLLAPGVMQ